MTSIYLGFHKILFEEKLGFVEKNMFWWSLSWEMFACMFSFFTLLCLFFRRAPNTKKTLPKFFQNFLDKLGIRKFEPQWKRHLLENWVLWTNLNVLNLSQKYTFFIKLVLFYSRQNLQQLFRWSPCEMRSN